MELDEMERMARKHLAELHRDFLKSCEPYIKILNDIHAMRPPAPIILDISRAQFLQARGDLKNFLESEEGKP